MHAVTRRSIHSALIQLYRRSPPSSSLVRQVAAARVSIGSKGLGRERYLSSTASRRRVNSDDPEARSAQQRGEGGVGVGGGTEDAAVRGGSTGGVEGIGGVPKVPSLTNSATTATASTGTIGEIGSSKLPEEATLEPTEETANETTAGKSRQQQQQSQRESKPRGRPINSSKRRTTVAKTKEKEEEPRPEIPDWFLEDNVLLVEQNIVRETTLECWIRPKAIETEAEVDEEGVVHQDGDTTSWITTPQVPEFSGAENEITEGLPTEVSGVEESTETIPEVEDDNIEGKADMEVESTSSDVPKDMPTLEVEQKENIDAGSLQQTGNSMVISFPVNKAAYMDTNLDGSLHDIMKVGKVVRVTQSRESGEPATADAEAYVPSTEHPEAAMDIPTKGTEISAGEEVATLQAIADVDSEANKQLKLYKYSTHVYVWREISAYVSAGLALSKPSHHDSAVALKSHLVLKCPRDGALYHLDSIVEHVAALVRADIVMIDAQDLEELAGDHLGDTRKYSASTISSQALRMVGYDAQLQNNAPPREEEEEEEQEVEEEGGADDESPEPSTTYAPSSSHLPSQVRKLAAGALQIPLLALIPQGMASSGSVFSSSSRPQPELLEADLKNERKVLNYLGALLSSAAEKRQQLGLSTYQDGWTNPVSTSTTPSSPDVTTAPSIPTTLSTGTGEQITIPTTTGTRTIIHVQDYAELQRTPQGATLLKMMHEIVLHKRKSGESIMIIGTTAGEETVSSLSRRSLEAMQELRDDSWERTIIVPPQDDYDMYEYDRKARVREVNMRHLRDIIRRRSGEGGNSIELDVPKDWHLSPPEDLMVPGMDEDVWTFDRAHRVALMAIGQYHKSFLAHVTEDGRSYIPGKLTIDNIISAVDAINQSDDYKFEWAAQERKVLRAREKEEEEAAENQKEEDEDDEAGKKGVNRSPDLMKKLMKTCNPHEKKLLSGVINPEKLHVGFSSVRAPPDTIEALRTLTGLSLIRPEAFQYGVLATDRIPGVLLYGPPGTGKTLLAKAVAKESGANVLEVSGSEIFDMYVGEGEKNVKAIFSLAQKLSPCVVFIDEADAIFGSRNSTSTRNTHREIINQFLKEWADFAKSSAFIMVATNRPFDLDDAVLRRLPRRILVDLPTKEDRLEILKIHLKDEILEPDVNIPELAEKTPLYSGSDLKNVCVAAALACVREEMERYKSSGKFPEKRRLVGRHFAKALEEIGASVSEDMGTLAAIRKFDERYGDRKGGKKRRSAWGFGSQVEKGLKGKIGESSEGRVRQLA